MVPMVTAVPPCVETVLMVSAASRQMEHVLRDVRRDGRRTTHVYKVSQNHVKRRLVFATGQKFYVRMCLQSILNRVVIDTDMVKYKCLYLFSMSRWFLWGQLFLPMWKLPRRCHL